MKRNLSDFFTGETAQKAGLVKKDGEANPLITGLEYDSRKVKPGNLFFALSGLHTNGSLYINDAVSKGAAVIVFEKADIEKKPDIVYIQVENSRFAMSPIAAAFYNYPSRKMQVIGVTGTEGKSTTVYLIWQLLTLMGKKAGFLSTVNHSLGHEVIWNSEHQTTPEATVVQRLLWEMAEFGCKYAVVESSSHGLSKKTNRLGDVNFCCGLVTNITHEHLEFHGTWEKYRDDKANLFRALEHYVAAAQEEPSPQRDASQEDASQKDLPFEPFGVINADDNSASFLSQVANIKTCSFSAAGNKADLTVEKIESDSWGNWYTLNLSATNENIEVRDKLPGAFNCNNVMAALLIVSGLLKQPVKDIVPFVNQLKPVRGRMTTIDMGQNFEVVIDYAHTPSSFQTIFPPLRERLDKKGRKIISLFGSAGERDTQKRAEQGKIATAYSDFIIITDEDPRGEIPMDICEEIAKGCEAEQKRLVFKRGENLFLIPDRPQAIRKALSLANAGDIVLLLGKGHENSIIYADYVMPYDEIAEAEKALDELLKD